MKILHLINTLESGGAERLVADIAPLQMLSKHSVTVAACSGRNAMFAVSLKKAGIEVIFLSACGSPRNPFLMAKIASLYDSLQPDIVHVHLFPAQYYAIAASWMAKHRPVFITTEHSSGNRRLGRPWWRMLERIIYSRYSAIVAVGEDVARIYEKWTRLKSNICIISNGLEIAAFSKPIDAETIRKIRDLFGVDERQRVIGWVGRLAPPKRPADLIWAIYELPEKFCAVLVGDGSLRKECEALAESLGILKRIKFLGERSDIPELLAAFDAFVLSSDYEGFGLAAAEAMASGIPLFLADLPALRSIAGQAGRYFTPGDFHALSVAISQSAEDPVDEKARIQEGKARASYLDIGKCAESYLRLYESLQGRR